MNPHLHRAMPGDYLAVAKMLALTLHVGRGYDLEPYRSFAFVLRTRLTPGERQALAWAALTACDDAEAEGVATDVLGNEIGAPLPTFLDVDEEAEAWASFASTRELRAYAAACQARLAFSRRAAA
jgi:hypothetical protein